MKPRRSVCGADEVAHHRRQAGDERHERADRAVESGAAARERVADADARGVDPGAGRRREHRQHLIEVDLRPRLRDGDRRPVGPLPAGVPERHVEVLLADRGLQPDREAAVDRQPLHRLVEGQVEHRDRLAAPGPPRADARHRPDQRATHVNLAAAGQLFGVAHLHVQVVAGHERQPVVRLEGEHDRDDRDQHRQRADQQRPREWVCGAPAGVQRPPPTGSAAARRASRDAGAGPG